MSTNAKKTQGNSELEPRQSMVIAHILLGKTQTDAANAAGVDPATVSRWKQEPIFLAELNRRRAELYEAHHSDLLAMAAEARAVVRESMQRGPNRLKAAIYVLDRLTPPSGPVDVEEIEIERRAVEQDRFFRSLR